jgi:hypothetical protein
LFEGRLIFRRKQKSPSGSPVNESAGRGPQKLTIDSFIRYGSLWTLVLGFVSLLFAIRNYRRQVNAQIFFEIAKRYDEMLQSFPMHEWTARSHPEHPIPELTLELKAGVVRYFAIVHFAFILHDLRYLSKDLWKMLQAEHHRTLASPLFRREWSSVRDEFRLFPSFLRYVESIQEGLVVIAADSVFRQGRWSMLRIRWPKPPDFPQ